jgi:predicted hotdog family 3-hydroxylacyl-ACP dehydratase
MNREQLLELVPHAGNMCLLDRVISHSALTIHCEAISHQDPRHPLRRDGQLAALHLVEYAAQAMAVHGALTTSGRARPGMLAALRDIRLETARIDDIAGPLAIEATRRVAQSDGLLYEFSIRGGGRELARGRIAIALA